MSYRLYDIALHHREQPEGFSIPRQDERNYLQAGEIVSIGFVAEGVETPEFMWVRVELVRQGGRYIGILLERPKTVPNLDANNRIEFMADHVFEIYIEEGDPRYFDQTKLAMVSGHVASEGAWPARLMRIPPMAQQYSGWLIYSGQEPAEYVKDFGNFVSKPLAELIEQFPNLKSVLASAVGSDWKWDADAAEYKI